MNKAEMLPYNYTLMNGKTMSNGSVDAYNAQTDKINQALAAGREAPEHILNGRHNILITALQGSQ